MLLELYVKMMAWLKSEEGQDLSEYAILIAIVAVIVVATIVTIGGQINTLFTRLSTALATAITGSGGGGGTTP